VVRFGGIYGPGRASLIERVRSGEATYPATYRQYQNRIHRDDCAGVLAYLMSHGEPASLYLGVDDEPTEKRVVLSWLADRLGAPPPRAVAEAVSDRGNKRCRNARLRRAGYRFRYPNFRAGYGALLGVDVDGLQK
jgi:nucleoside-diphosphate-sugar epimerase